MGCYYCGTVDPTCRSTPLYKSDRMDEVYIAKARRIFFILTNPNHNPDTNLDYNPNPGHYMFLMPSRSPKCVRSTFTQVALHHYLIDDLAAIRTIGFLIAISYRLL